MFGGDGQIDEMELDDDSGFGKLRSLEEGRRYRAVRPKQGETKRRIIAWSRCCLKWLGYILGGYIGVILFCAAVLLAAFLIFSPFLWVISYWQPDAWPF